MAPVSPNAKKLLEEALELPDESRAELAAALIESLDEPGDSADEVESSWSSEIESRRRHRTLAGYLGIRDPKQRHSVNQRALGMVAALAALVFALGLLRYCASSTRPPESEGGPASAIPAGTQPSG